MAQLNTKIVLRNDSSAAWLAAQDSVLLKGEIGIEFNPAAVTESGAKADYKVKMKVGDGVSTWAELPYFGGEESKVFQVDSYEALPTEDVAIGDTGVVKTLISGDKYSYTAYVYTTEGWAAMDGNYNAENVYFDENILITTAVGNITLTNGQGTIPAAGKNIKQVFESIWAKEDLTLTINQPSISLSVSGNATGEIGSTFTRPTATLKITGLGDYEYGSKNEAGTVYTKANGTGVSFSEMKVGFGSALTGLTEDNSTTQTGTYGTNATVTYTADETDIPSNVFAENVATYYFCGQATHGTTDRKPVTNMGNFIDSAGKATDVYANGTKQIASATLKKEGTDGRATWKATSYRNSFYGTYDSKEGTGADSDSIRTLTPSGKTLSNGSTFEINIPTTAQRVVIAYPSGLRDLTSVLDKNDSNANIVSGFGTPKTVSVAGANGYGAIDYKVYTMDFAGAYGVTNTFTVTI